MPKHSHFLVTWREGKETFTKRRERKTNALKLAQRHRRHDVELVHVLNGERRVVEL